MVKKFFKQVLYIISVIYFLFGGNMEPLFAKPEKWQMSFQEPATEIMERIISFHSYILIILIFIVVSVTGVLIYVVFRFHKSRNATPSDTTHNTLIEIVWTVIPLLIVFIITVPSIKLLYYEETIPAPEMTVKIIGNQWYWSYDYLDNEGIQFDSNLMPDDKLQDGDLRLLAVDNKLVLPIDTNVRFLLTATDVIHSWSVPALGVKKDCVPGRINETWANIKKTGTYHGQCYELCGPMHGFMPIVVEAVTKEEFEKWVKNRGTNE